MYFDSSSSSKLDLGHKNFLTQSHLPKPGTLKKKTPEGESLVFLPLNILWSYFVWKHLLFLSLDVRDTIILKFCLRQCLTAQWLSRVYVSIHTTVRYIIQRNESVFFQEQLNTSNNWKMRKIRFLNTYNIHYIDLWSFIMMVYEYENIKIYLWNHNLKN